MGEKYKGSLQITGHQNLGDKIYHLQVDGSLQYQGPKQGLAKELKNYHPRCKLLFGDGVGHNDQIHFTKALTQ